MKAIRLLAIAVAAGAAATSLSSASAGAQTRPEPALAPHPAAATRAATPPAGLRPLAIPTAKGHLPARASGTVPRDSVACDNGESIRSAASGLWVSAELGYGGGYYAMLRARAPVIGPWEQYAFCWDFDTGDWIIISDANGLAVSTELGYGGGYYAMLRARASAIGPWEQYNLYCTGSKTLVIQSRANGGFVSAELGYPGSFYGMLRARAGSVGAWEQYYTATTTLGCYPS